MERATLAGRALEARDVATLVAVMLQKDRQKRVNSQNSKKKMQCKPLDRGGARSIADRRESVSRGQHSEKARAPGKKPASAGPAAVWSGIEYGPHRSIQLGPPEMQTVSLARHASR